MKAIRILTLLLSVFILLILQACGGGGSGSSGQAQSTTVALQSQVKSGTSMAVFSSYSAASWGPTMDFTLKSVINPNAGAMASDVHITSQVISYEYSNAIPVGAGSSLLIPPLTWNVTQIIPAGGSADLQNLPVLSPAQKLYLRNNNPLTAASDFLNFKVKVTFNGYEVKNGNNVSVSVLSNVILTQ